MSLTQHSLKLLFGKIENKPFLRGSMRARKVYSEKRLYSIRQLRATLSTSSSIEGHMFLSDTSYSALQLCHLKSSESSYAVQLD